MSRLLFAQWPLMLYYRPCGFFGKRAGVRVTARPVPVIVSLTSFGPRLKSATVCIESLLRQSVRPDRLILWLAHDEDVTGVAASLRRLERRGLEVKRCDDWKAFKKIIPTVRDNPDAIIVTADDDVFYPWRWLEKLLDAYKHQNDVIHCHRSRIMAFGDDGKLLPYARWPSGDAHAGVAAFSVFPKGVGGVLYPPGSMDARVADHRSFMALSSGNDDIWLKAMSLLAGTRCKQTKDFPHGYLEVPHSQTVSLWHTNVERGANDEQLGRVFSRFGLVGRLRDGTITAAPPIPNRGRQRKPIGGPRRSGRRSA